MLQSDLRKKSLLKDNVVEPARLNELNKLLLVEQLDITVIDTCARQAQ